MVKVVAAAGVAAFLFCGWAVTPDGPSRAPSVAPAEADTSGHLDAGQGAGACSHYAWPYYVSACLYDARGLIREGRKVRFVVIDRLPPRAESAD